MKIEVKDFVNIVPVFNPLEGRSVSGLMRVYHDSGLLKNKILEALSDQLTGSEVRNKKILLKPNWVTHSTKETDQWCLRTHDEFLLAVLEIILGFQPKSVIIGDAPIQGCNWEKVVTKSLAERIASHSKAYNVPVSLKDFRRVTFEPSKNNPVKERNPLSDYLIFDLGRESFLEPISNQKKIQFRVTNYDPDRMAESHRPGVHKYCITKELFEADVVISLPKVKTHQKAGITAALKNIVGLNGDKDFLPHHRMGGTGMGGDCYPGKNIFRFWSELFLDFANRRQGRLSYWLGYRTSNLLWKLSFPKKHHQIAAGWHGNDTTWRMVLDLNKIVIYGKSNGSLARESQRQLYSLSDGIIGGQGDGPLNPEPLPLGIIGFTNHSGMHDITMAALMGFDFEKIPMLKQVSNLSEKDKVRISWNGNETSMQRLKVHAVKTLPPPGWVDHLKI